MAVVHLVLYVISCIVSATFLFREYFFYPSEKKEKVADVNYCAYNPRFWQVCSISDLNSDHIIFVQERNNALSSRHRLRGGYYRNNTASANRRQNGATDRPPYPR